MEGAVPFNSKCFTGTPRVFFLGKMFLFDNISKALFLILLEMLIYRMN